MVKFEKEFLLGAATAAHQVEGNNIYSDCWAQENMEFSDYVEPSGKAVDHYHRFEEDIRLMAEAGLNAYRFSIEWARIEPEQGRFDDNEIAHYRDVLKCCRAYGIEPIVTMHHFSSPMWLIRQGGWENEETIGYFADYCKYVIEQLGDEINFVCTINEANMGLQLAAIIEKYMKIMNATDRTTAADDGKNVESHVQVGMNLGMMNQMKRKAEENRRLFGMEQPHVFLSDRTKEGDMLVIRAHQAAKAAMKAVKPSLQVGITLSLHDVQSVPGGEARASEEWDAEFGHYLPYIIEDDFFGIQNYTRSVYGADGIEPNPRDARITQMDYENYPEALEHVIRRVNKELPIPLIVTENGIATSDDEEREIFILKALEGVKRCMEEGIPVRGYCYWSLLDNFEWAKGFSMTFGLIEVDRNTMNRQPKKSLKTLGGCRV